MLQHAVLIVIDAPCLLAEGPNVGGVLQQRAQHVAWPAPAAFDHIFDQTKLHGLEELISFLIPGETTPKHGADLLDCELAPGGWLTLHLSMPMMQPHYAAGAWPLLGQHCQAAAHAAH